MRRTDMTSTTVTPMTKRNTPTKADWLGGIIPLTMTISFTH